MTINSMTGFGRSAGADATATWAWEVRSVNGRGLDLRCRMPAGYEALEAPARAALAARFARGSFTLSLTVERAAAATQLRVNRAALDQVLAVAREFHGRGEVAPPRLDGLLALRGVIENADDERLTQEQREAREGAIAASLDGALAGLAAARAAEGREIEAALSRHLDEIERLVEEARANAATQAPAIKAKLQAQLDELLGTTPAIAPERLAQEAAMLALKADVREELDRLGAHIKAARALFKEGGAVGRKLDFLSQEFNREANTLCSKSADVALTRTGLALKAAIDRLREQAANVE